VKVGIGPGSTCITRIVTGVGIPQLSAIQLCAAAAKKYGVPIIGDGGIRTSGDLSKAIAAGADTVMFGNLIAGTEESPGDYILDGGVAYKVYRGGASRESFEDKLRKENKKSDGLYRAPEGKAGRVPYRGEVSGILKDMGAGFRSSMSYLGAKDIPTFQKNAEFVRITEAGRKESTAHGV
jgi:IMP dehydrogenase